MTTDADGAGPLILGSGGRLGRAFRHLVDAGQWPGPSPLFHARRADAPDLLAGPIAALDGSGTRVSGARGMIVLAGATSGDADALAGNTTVALEALALADRLSIEPVLLLSSAAVYGRAEGPQAEGPTPRPTTPYGAAKLAMEAAVAGRPNAVCLRLANVAGCDALFGAAARGPVTLDRFADGTSPRRAMIGPLTLARSLTALIDLHLAGTSLPPVINLAAPGTVAMADLLAAAGLDWTWRDAPAGALPEMALDTARLGTILPLAPQDAAEFVAEARLAGWRPA